MKKKIFGWAGKILRVDLTNRKVATESTMKYAKGFLGGRGINSWILYKENPRRADPFDAENRLIFGTGVLAGTMAPCSSRFTVTAKNALTGGLGDANCGGDWSAELKYAGYDHIIVQGRAEKPVYILIRDTEVEIKDARNIWGKITSETDEIIKEDTHDYSVQVACIGPAGERRVRSACIITNRVRAAGKCGLGAVMGSKNLKAIAVRGMGSVEVADPEKFMTLVDNSYEKMLKDPYVQVLRTYSTAISADRLNGGFLPYKNFQDDFFPDVDKAGGKVIVEKFGVKSLACFSCPRPCSLLLDVNEGEFAGVKTWALEGNAVMDYGSRLAINSAPAIIKAHQLCSEYGLDEDSSSGVIAWAFECFEKGILTKEDTDCLELRWGDYKMVLELIRKLAYREGFGNILAEGVKRASEKIGRGSERYAMHVKGMELADVVRASKGWGFGVIVSVRGPCHLRGATASEVRNLSPEVAEKVYGVPTAGNPKTFEGKAKLVIYFERLKAIVDACGICYFTSLWQSPNFLSIDDYGEFITASTGWRLTHNDLITIADRIHNVEKAINVIHGFTRKDDLPPKRFFAEKVKAGPAKGEYIDEKMFDKTLNEYYTLRGWDSLTGMPKKSTLETLDLKGIAKELKSLGKLFG